MATVTVAYGKKFLITICLFLTLRVSRREREREYCPLFAIAAHLPNETIKLMINREFSV